jgi:hypothetical protein
VLLNQVSPSAPLAKLTDVALWTVFALTLLSGLHYIWLVGHRLRGALAAGSGKH